MLSLRGPLFFFALFLSSLMGCVFMLAPVLPLMVIAPRMYRWITHRMLAAWLTLPPALLELLLGVRVRVWGDWFEPNESSLILMNHRTRLDWMFLWSCLMRRSELTLLKICLKSALKSVPGFGWAMQVGCYLFLSRRWMVDRSHLSNILKFFCHIREPVQILLFPEGTDLTEHTRSRSDEFAEKHSLPKYEFVLHPRTTGFTFMLETLRQGGNLDALHDITVAYPQLIPQTEGHLLAGQFPEEIHFHLQRFPVASVPEDSAGLQIWLQDLWKQKEQRLQEFYCSRPPGFHPDMSQNRTQMGFQQAPDCQRVKSELEAEGRVWMLQAASLLYWSVFCFLSCLSLWLWTTVRFYFLLVAIFFLFQQPITGGVEMMEVACHRLWSREEKVEEKVE
ncbi:hypothetical protein DNTS_029658 [Danionella cerebrum]|uniref:Phospholipid/glycerol acyltransferase domain-containing protein n=1 Tax=Danionella cerebrum TaxID=2873325 RepID=A0A553QFM8_9TELE|nr:hypothetical protein DNTS_029658 [Danionella translucida]TRY88717.1 hypothetical protein DNTS_029658 [Danionella translucida]